MPIIYLSPSTQDWNMYVTGSGSEEYNMNLLADAKCASAGYPVAQGLGIVLFFLAGCFKNAPGKLSFAGFLLISGGIAMLAVK